MRLRALATFAILAAAASASAQSIETDPLQCWWRTSAPAVRVGQPFTLVLTCSVVDTTTVTVVPNQAPLDPIVTQMPPFEVLGGTHQADLRTADHRFFQYEYRLRIVTEDSFGKDVKLPDMTISYHLQSRTGEGPAIEGRELMYNLPPMSVRVLSLVPGDETDIRDASSSTFGDVESRLFRANVFRTIAGVLFTLAGLGILVAAVRLLSGYRAKSGADAQLLPDMAILRRLGRECSNLDRERRTEGWTPALIDRLATALRITGAYALSGRVIQAPLTSARTPEGGHLIVGAGLLRRRQVVVAGSVTPEVLRQQCRQTPSDLLQELEHALDRVTVKQYAREPRVEDDELNEALEAGARAVRRVKSRHTWLKRKLADLNRFRAPVEQQAWSRWNG